MAETETNAVVTITDDNFQQLLDGGKPLFIDFWAVWCGPCRLVGPIVEQLAPSYDGKAVIGKLDVDNNPRTAATFGVTSIPTMIMFKDGKQVDRMVGARPKGELQSFIDRNL